MIQELTKENLQKLGYNENDVNELFNTINTFTLQCNDGNIFVSKPENKFYTGIDFYRVTYFNNGNLRFPFACPELFNEYYTLALSEFLEKQKALFGMLFNELEQTDKFILLETKRNELIIKEQKDYIKLHNKRQWHNKEKIINILETYIYFINNQPQQPEAVKPDEVKKELHNDIFKYNAFEVFEFYKEKKQIKVNSRTDLRVIFELLKGDNLLLPTIELKHYIDWLNRVYYNNDITELKKQNLNSKPNIIRANDYNDYKKATLKQP
jgi:hypothetical protein